MTSDTPACWTGWERRYRWGEGRWRTETSGGAGGGGCFDSVRSVLPEVGASADDTGDVSGSAQPKSRSVSRFGGAGGESLRLLG